MTQPSKISLVIVNYNGGEYITTAIEHVKSQTRPPDELIVVDNASTDGSPARIDLTGLPNARMIRLDENVGFARANNLAAETATGDWLVLLNPDTRPRPSWLEELEKAASEHPGVSMFASAQLDAENPDIMDGAGDCYFVLGIPWRGGFGMKADKLPGEGDCFSPCGAAAMYDRETFLRAGGFDESFFCYCEDVDLGFRLRLAGETCRFVPSAVVLHHGSAISGRYSEFTVRLGTRNRLRTYLTNMPPVALALTLPGHILGTLYLYLRTLGKPHASAMRKGLLEGMGMLPAIAKRRREVQAARRLSSLQIVQAMSWNPLRLHRRAPHVRSWKRVGMSVPSESRPTSP